MHNVFNLIYLYCFIPNTGGFGLSYGGKHSGTCHTLIFILSLLSYQSFMSLIASLTKIIKLKVSFKILERNLLNVTKIVFFLIFVNKGSKLEHFSIFFTWTCL